jgi:ribosomal-protein-alanine N-acetyltransferase
MADAYQIRTATSADLAAVHRIESECFDDPWSRGAFRAHLRDLFLVAGAPEAICGYLVAWRLGPEAEILNLAVTKPARRSGTGRALLDAALRILAEFQTRRVFLEVRVSNLAARRLYASAGFTEIGRRRDYYRLPREDALVLARVFGGVSPPEGA